MATVVLLSAATATVAVSSPEVRDTVEQAVSNASAASTGTLGSDLDAGVREIYRRHFREAIHPRW